MSVLRVQTITNEAGDGPVEFTQGLTLPASQTLTGTDTVINTTGIASITQLETEALTVGIMTATSFVGNGAQITNAPGTPAGKVISLHLIT